MNNAHQIQEAVRNYWHNKPCDSEISIKNPDTSEFYMEIEKGRYQYQYHIPRIIDWIDWSGKEVLEIGTGVGTDARQIITKGGAYTGINIDAGSVEATKKALDVFGLQGIVRQACAADIPLNDNSVDIVYSFGVLHHIPEVDRAVEEIYRVLKSGGELLIMLYNRNSINYQIEIRVLRKLVLRLLALPGVISMFSVLGFPKEKLQRHADIYRTYGKLDEQEWLNRNTDGPDNPYSQVYSESEVESLLQEGFKILRNDVFYFEARHWGMLGSMLPKSLVDYLGRRWGWHRIIHAVKT